MLVKCIGVNVEDDTLVIFGGFSRLQWALYGSWALGRFTLIQHVA